MGTISNEDMKKINSRALTDVDAEEHNKIVEQLCGEIDHFKKGFNMLQQNIRDDSEMMKKLISQHTNSKKDAEKYKQKYQDLLKDLKQISKDHK